MNFRLTRVAAVILAMPLATPLAATAQNNPPLALDAVKVSAPKITPITSPLPKRPTVSDTAELLENTAGISLYGAGGVSSLPALHGLADDRLRIQVDGMDLMSACPNHMNSALSYMDSSRVGAITVFAGITPVSVGGDSIGGTIQVQAAPPEFAENANDVTTITTKGQIGTFYRSNGKAAGANLNASYVGENINLTYSGGYTRSDNLTSATGKNIGSTGYTVQNHDVRLAVRRDSELFQLNVGTQHLPFEGFPNQRMDMTGNDNTQVNVRYQGEFDWGRFQARAYSQRTDHAMNMGADRFGYGTLGMPMNTTGKTQGGLVQVDWDASDRDLIKIGLESQTYTLYDWWPPAGGVMAPRDFWNVDYGTRKRLGAFVEWEALWSSELMTLWGVRHESVSTDAGFVQGYNSQPIWAADAAAFNAQSRQRTDSNWDMSALARYTPDVNRTLEGGFSRKTRSPNLYQRYPWSTQPMATLMNNFVGDGNGYVGNLNLKPEIAYTASMSADWHDAASAASAWQFKTTAYITWVDDFMDAQRCNFGQCGGASNLTKTNGFVNLQYVNQSARLYGFDVSGYRAWSNAEGQWKVSGLMSWVRGENQTTGDNLYNIMPLNAKLALEHRRDAWTHTAEWQLVAPKTQVSQVRNEITTAGYGLFHWRSSYEAKQIRLDLGIDNVFNQPYSHPLGGAYVGEGASMTSLGIPWGVPVAGKGRSMNVAVSYRF